MQFEGTLGAEHSAINVDIIFPCNARHISKYSAQKSFIMVETPEVYRAVTLPHIESLPAASIQWVYNILEKKKEADRMLFEDPHPETGFMLHPDQKWDQTQARSPPSGSFRPPAAALHLLLPLVCEHTRAMFIMRSVGALAERSAKAASNCGCLCAVMVSSSTISCLCFLSTCVAFLVLLLGPPLGVCPAARPEKGARRCRWTRSTA